MSGPPVNEYRGRLAPSPTGFFHLGHARTFWVAWRRARSAQGKLIFRNEDLDYQRCKPEFIDAMYEDLRWLGLDWDEGPDFPPQSGKNGQPGDPAIGGPYAPYSQSERRNFYLDAWRKLRDSGWIYPCTCSRKDLERSLSAPHEPLHGAPLHGAIDKTINARGAQAPSPAYPSQSSTQPGAATLQITADDELSYPGTCREKISTAANYASPAGVSWRFKVPDGETISFADGHFGSSNLLPDMISLIFCSGVATTFLPTSLQWWLTIPPCGSLKLSAVKIC